MGGGDHPGPLMLSVNWRLPRHRFGSASLVPVGFRELQEACRNHIRGPGWSPPPMGFYIGILIKSSPPKGGVHKLMILLRDLPKEFLRKFFGEEMGGVRGTQTP